MPAKPGAGGKPLWLGGMCPQVRMTIGPWCKDDFGNLSREIRRVDVSS
jgi:hypothetical protein